MPDVEFATTALKGKSMIANSVTRYIVLILTILVLPVVMLGQTTQPTTLPDTPNKKMFFSWLAAVNSGDSGIIQRFDLENSVTPPKPEEAAKNSLFAATGGLDLQAITRADSRSVYAIARDRHTGYVREIRMALAPGDPVRIQGIAMRQMALPENLLPHVALSDAEITQRADHLIDTLVATDQFSGVIYVARGNEPIYARAAGFASRQWNQPNRIDTRFNLASIGKMFTAISIAQLVEQGKLSYAETLADALPSYPDKALGAKITIDQLLSHTSGLTTPAFADADALKQTLSRGFLKIDQYLPKEPVDSLKFDPDSKIEYSNYGYLLLGAIIEKASGEDYFDYVRNHIFKPAGMSDSDFYELDSEPTNLATGYMDAPGGRRSNIFNIWVKGSSCGGGYSTGADMVKFAQALRNHTLLNESSQQKVWTGKKEYIGRGKYGYGCIVSEYNGQRLVSHGGGYVGITNWFEIYPELGCTVVVLTNIDDDPNPIAYQFREWLTQGR